jgi:hypothetical protein
MVMALSLLPAVTYAQGAASDCVPFLLNGSVAECSASGTPMQQLRTATFIAGSEAAGETLARALALEVVTAPSGSSSGGFTFTLNPITGVHSRRSGTFGPVFSERAVTIGKGKISVGFNMLHRSYSQLDGLSLNGFDVFRFHGGTLPVTSSRMELEVTADTFAGFASYGVLDNLDVGITIPYVQLSVEGVSRIYDVSNDELQRVFMNASAKGVGDMSLFGKYRFWTQAPPSATSEEVRGGLAGTITLRLPSGSEDDLIGLGMARTAFSLVGSTTVGRFAPHINAGYDYWSKGFDIPTDFQGLSSVAAKDQFHYSVGFEYEAHPQLSLMVDVLGRYLRGAGSVGYQPFLFPQNFASVSGADALVVIPQGVHTVLIAPGVKWNVLGSSLLTVNALISTTNNGLRARVSPVVGFDWSPN